MAISHFLAAILDLCKLAYFPCRDFSGLLVCWSSDLREMHCGKKKSVAISFLKNASLPGLYPCLAKVHFRMVASPTHKPSIMYMTAVPCCMRRGVQPEPGLHDSSPLLHKA